ncbi:hypothetical protein [Beijerinckia indica]|uniref:Uncharacterized protein n=1 Tax=Beijerinckia indica subsp. indica (strain ATCC 9039 / DSM 1715 / NCIMB 8712) TaxID=395963 RepID=B2IL82_BEII9|nr:hypothetical protein [Beijerinckia indica]ACB97282.1 hypothetical protein Bind_3731 [Beijerinckia indica subsp. indica ATCC 9039]
MIPAAIAKALRLPALEADLFQPTQWDSPADKAAFGNALLRFLAEDCPKEKFKKPFYQRLSNCFGHIAHYNVHGFYETFFTSTADKIEFLQQTLGYPCWGDPAHTFSDLERVVVHRIAQSGLLDWHKRTLTIETETREKAMLARLKAKYEPDPLPSKPSASTPIVPAPIPVSTPAPPQQTTLFDLFS